MKKIYQVRLSNCIEKNLTFEFYIKKTKKKLKKYKNENYLYKKKKL